ncbi:GDP-L-fucose synthase [Aestuariivirga litoralis]|uniref:GDP-L-fucose synthase n=1 Tax=Aestuariivirga litoralis TaxID=2650924 RepID=A0A2W2AU49_9HYPH|nr:GDP-L-fucose synthase [Aestuariivirga litoralis]PZF78785.1 GDP-L-fucose synthase [Aestuariivirga litoralis]
MTVVLPYSLAGKRVWVAGEHGMVGSALIRRLAEERCDLLRLPRRAIDFRDQAATTSWIKANRPDAVFLAAARVGGIAANAASPASFLYDNLMIAANIIHAAHEAEVERLVFLGSTCIYPKHAPQPIAEEALLTGPLEETNEWYAIAKIAGLKLCQAYRRQHGRSYIACQPTNLYGPGDNYDLETSHVLPALLRKAHEAKLAQAPRMTVWGSGRPLREFLHVDDLADAAVFLARHYDGETAINIGSGEEVSIGDLARLVCRTVGFRGELAFDSSRPDGTPRKLSDTSRLRALGWNRARPLAEGLAETYAGWLASPQRGG